MSDNEHHTTQEVDGGEDTPRTEDNTPQPEAKSQASGEPRSEESYMKEIADLRREAAKYRSERNALRDDAEKWHEHEEAQKTDLQKAEEQLASSKQRESQLEAELKRMKVLSEFGISEENADLLGDDPEKFESNAQKLAKIQEEAAKKAAPPSEQPVAELKKLNEEEDPQAKDFGFPSSWPVSGPFAKKN